VFLSGVPGSAGGNWKQEVDQQRGKGRIPSFHKRDFRLCRQSVQGGVKGGRESEGDAAKFSPNDLNSWRHVPGGGSIAISHVGVRTSRVRAIGGQRKGRNESRAKPPAETRFPHAPLPREKGIVSGKSLRKKQTPGGLSTPTAAVGSLRPGAGPGGALDGGWEQSKESRGAFVVAVSRKGPPTLKRGGSFRHHGKFDETKPSQGGQSPDLTD